MSSPAYTVCHNEGRMMVALPEDLTLAISSDALHKAVGEAGEAWRYLQKAMVDGEVRRRRARIASGLERLAIVAMVGFACFVLGMSLPLARNDSDSARSNGESVGGDYGHSTDYCGSACGTGTAFLRDGRDGPAYGGPSWHGAAGQASRNGF
jgi:hypothetical protein